MKKFRSIFFTLLLVTMIAGGGVLPQAAALLAGNGVQVSLNALDEVTEDVDFAVTVAISELVDLNGAQYDVSFDPSILRLDDITSGQIDSTEMPVQGFTEVSPGTGTYRVVQSMMFGTVSGSGYLSVLHFHTVGAGLSDISLANGTLSGWEGEIPATWIGDSVNVISTGDGGGDGELPPATPPLPEPEVTDTSNIIDDDGFFTENAIVSSEDSNIRLTISQGTRGLTKENEPLPEIIMQLAESPATPPENSVIIGLNYELGPDGASFDPAIELTFTYDPPDVPDGIDEEDLVIAWWDKGVSEWIKLADSSVDINAHTITASVNHFTAFTILAYIPASPTPIFTISDPVISPSRVGLGENLIISAVVSNIGDANGSYDVTLKIDGSRETQTVAVAAGDSMRVSFTVSRDIAGTYSVDVNGKAGSFIVVEELAPASTPTAEVVTEEEGVVTEEEGVVTEEEGVVTEEEGVVTEEEAAPASPQPGKPVNWPVLWGVIGGIVIVAALAIFLRVRRRLY